MTRSEPGKRLWSLGLFVLPLVAVKAAAVLLGGSSPEAANASQSNTANNAATASAAQTVATRVDWTHAQRAAAVHVRELDAKPFGPAPMLYAPAPVIVAPVEPEPVPIVIPDKVRPHFLLHAVMTAPNGNKALINTHMLQVGEQVGESSWFVREIDLNGRSVTLRDSTDGELLTITVQRPG